MNDGEHGEAGEDQAGHRQGVNAPGEQTTGSAGRRSALRGDIGVGGCHRKPSVGAQVARASYGSPTTRVSDSRPMMRLRWPRSAHPLAETGGNGTQNRTRAIEATGRRRRALPESGHVLAPP